MYNLEPDFDAFDDELDEQSELQSIKNSSSEFRDVIVNEKRAYDSNPYAIKITNTGKKERTAYLFGFNKFSHENNFGNHRDLKMECVFSNVSYGQIVNQSAYKPFVVAKFRFISQNSGAIFGNCLTINQSDANGCLYSSPSNLIPDAYQQQSTAVDLSRKVTVDGGTYFSLKVPAKTTIIIYAYPVKKLDLTNMLNEGMKRIRSAVRVNQGLARPYKLTKWMKVKWIFRELFYSSKRAKAYKLSA